ncbi:MAG: zinc ribbon domain-containing protein [Promethearchaeota archaeon]
MSNIDQKSVGGLSKYGKGLKYYAMAKAIWVAFMISFLVVLAGPIENFADMSEQIMMENAEYILLLALFVIIGFLGGGIILIVTYFNYLLKLTKATQTSMGQSLRTVLIFEIGVLATYITNLFLIIPEKIYVTLVSIAFSIGATIYLGKWVKSLFQHSVGEIEISKMRTSIRIMTIGLIVKVGLVLRLFSSPSIDYAGMLISYAGDIILIVGMFMTAKAILNTFNVGGFYVQKRGGPAQQTSTAFGQGLSPSNASPIQSPVSRANCPFCGAQILDPTTKFCSGCGKKIE